MLRRKSKKKVVFGESGVTGVKYLGDLPFQWAGTYTGKIYVWRRETWPVWVDKRDLPGLAEAVGRDMLESTGLPALEEPKAKKAKIEPKPEPEPVPVPDVIEEVD